MTWRAPDMNRKKLQEDQGIKHIYYLSKMVFTSSYSRLSVCDPVLSRLVLSPGAHDAGLASLQMMDPAQGSRRVQTPVRFFLNYFSDQNYNICFTNSIWSVLLTPHIIPLWWDSVHYWLCRNAAVKFYLLCPKHCHVLSGWCWRLIWPY